MKKLLLLLLFIPLVSFGQEDIERFKVYGTDNIYTSILLDTATGKTWQLQIGIGDSSTRIKSVLSDKPYAEFLEDATKEWTEKIDQKMKDWEENYNSKPDSIVSAKDKKYWKPMNLEQWIEVTNLAQNGRFKLYPTENTYNFIMVDVINGRTWQVQWNIDYDKRLCYRIY